MRTVADRQRPTRGLGGLPGDVQPEPGGPAAAGPPLDRIPGRVEAGPGVQHAELTTALGPGGQPDGEPGTLRGVREHVAEQYVQAGGQVRSGQPDRHRLVRDLDRHLPVLVVGQHGPERGPFRGDLHGVAGAGPVTTAPGVLDQRGHRLLQGLHAGGEPAVGVTVVGGLGLQPQRRQRGAQPVRQVGEGLPVLPDQLADPARQVVQAAGHLADLVRAGRVSPGLQVPVGQPLGHPGQLGDGPGDRAGQPDSDGHAEREQHEAQAGQDQPRLGDPVGQLRIADEGPDHRGPAARARHRDQDLPAAGHRPR